MNAAENDLCVVHKFGMGPCALTGRDTEGLEVSFLDGSFTHIFLSHRSFRQIAAMKEADRGKNGKQQ